MPNNFCFAGPVSTPTKENVRKKVVQSLGKENKVNVYLQDISRVYICRVL